MNSSTSPVDIRPDHLEIVQDILRERLPAGFQVWVFGSRAKWATTEASDLDLAMAGPSKLDYRVMAGLETAFEESNLPYTVDVVDLNTVSKEFKKIVEAQRIPLLPSAAPRKANGEWRKVPLGDVCAKIGSGATPRGGKDVYLEEGSYTLIRSQNVYNGGFHRDGLVFISESHADALQNVEVLEEDVLLNITGDSVARVCQVTPDVLPARVNQHVAIIRPDLDSLDAGYLRYYLESPEMQTLLLSWAGSGGTRNALTKAMIESLEIPLPPLPEQRAIAHVLGALDDKIELNRRMNDTLEAMTRAIFQDWFVDFGPTRAKMEGQEPYLPPELWDLFPDELVDSEMGEIPEGWERKRVSDCFRLTMGQSPPGNTYNEDGDGLPFFQGSTDFGATFPTNKRFCSAPTRTAQIDDTLVSVRAPIGDINMAWEKCCIGRGVSALRHKSGAKSFTYHSAVYMKPEMQIYEQNGTVFGAITKKQFESLPVLNPPKKLLDHFEALAEPLTQSIRNNTDNMYTLIDQRGTLLQKLMTGELKPQKEKV